MSFSVANSVNSALLSGTFGLQQASKGITQASFDIANRAAHPRDTTDVLADAAKQQLRQPRDLLSGLGNKDNLTGNLLSLQNNLNYAQASSKVIGVAKDLVGNLIDDIA
ncbi:hypothetical protein [Neptunicella sp. SCSIO 80796]|uniref:hypothetical protein n=1 Tax=Neptunicella plasticusilytica TaxID=3117012 RepID=UPI003A4E5D19